MIEVWYMRRFQAAAGTTVVRCVAAVPDAVTGLAVAYRHGPGRYRLTTAEGATLARLEVPGTERPGGAEAGERLKREACAAA